jgi:hypothetical protein
MVVMASSGPFGMCWVGFVGGMFEKYLAFAHFLSKNPAILHPITNQYPASPYHHPSICPFDAN